MPFKKGQGGRPRGASNKRTTLEQVLIDVDPTDGKVYWQQLHHIAADPHDDAHARIKALTLLFAYRYGRPVERHEHSGPAGGPIEVHDHFAVPAPR